jgi:hypothetical protein
MKKKELMYALLLVATVFLSGHSVAAQDSTAMAAEYDARVDSLVSSYERQEKADEKRKNSDNLSDLKAEKRESKANAKEAQRVENEANDAARESKMAYRKEKKAQRTREQADRQSKKAAKARTISEQNK